MSLGILKFKSKVKDEKNVTSDKNKRNKGEKERNKRKYISPVEDILETGLSQNQALYYLKGNSMESKGCMLSMPAP